MNAATFVQKLWNYCNVLRGDGMSYGDHVGHPLDMVSVAPDQLGKRVTSLAGHGQAIADALDELLTRSWG